VVVLAIDAANGALLRRWAADGTLPNIGALGSTGLTGETRSLDGFFVGSTWPSFFTGVNPARHGFHSLVQLRPGSYQFRRRVAGDGVKGVPFWDYLSRAGRRVAILDVPLSDLCRWLNGVQTVEWGSHDAAYGFRAWPQRLASEIPARFGSHPLGSGCDAVRRGPDEYRRFVERARDGVRRKAELTAEFLAQGGWDFFMQVFTEAHCVGHQCWHFHDARHPAHDPAAVDTVGDPVREVYAAIDAAVGDITRRAGPGALVMLLVLHGMSFRYGAQFLLREILFRLGAASPPAPARATPASLAPERLARVWRRLPAPLRRALTPLRERFRARSDDAPPTIQVDPRSSRCFVVDNGLAVGGIRLNLAGREPLGTVRPGADAEAFCDALARDLTAIVDAGTGRPLVRRVLRTSDVYRGEYRDDLPDLLVEWSDEQPVGSAVVGGGAGATVRASSPKTGTIEGVNRYGRTGDHRPEGLFLASGPGVRPGRLGRPLSILDLAPTLTRLFGVDLPDADGRPIPELDAPRGLPRGQL
jgi:predicted AlkP superfamily phosphohydrolase/phosphomutase